MSEIRNSGVLLQIETVRLPEAPALPPGYSLRGWQRGDEERVPVLLGEAFGPHRGTYAALRQFWRERAGLGPQGVIIIERDSLIVATASARVDPAAMCGWIHLVAVRPDHARRRLGTQAVLSALQRLQASGVGRVLVGTGSHRLAAIRLYLRLGFRPVIRDRKAEEIWARLLGDVSMAGTAHE